MGLPLFQNFLDFPVGDLNLTICLRMVGGSYFVVDIILLEQLSNDAIDEMRAFISDKGSGCSKSREDIFFQKFSYCHCIVLHTEATFTHYETKFTANKT